MDKLRAETIELIKQIYKKYSSGGALHIVLDDGNDDDIVEITNPCIKCGTLSVLYMNVQKQIEKDIAELKGGEG